MINVTVHKGFNGKTEHIQKIYPIRDLTPFGIWTEKEKPRCSQETPPYALVLAVLLAVSACFISQIALADGPSSAPSSSSTSNSAANGESYTTDDYWASKAMVDRLLHMINDPELDEAQRAAVEEALRLSSERLGQIENELIQQAAARAAEDAAAAARIAAAEAAAAAKCTETVGPGPGPSLTIVEATHGPTPAQGSFFSGPGQLLQKELKSGWERKENKGFIFKKDA